MKTLLMIFAVAIASINVAKAHDCEEVKDGVWVCPLPTKPSGPPTCQIVGDNLICNKDAVISAPVEKKSPSNCGWVSKRNRYECW